MNRMPSQEAATVQKKNSPLKRSRSISEEIEEINNRLALTNSKNHPDAIADESQGPAGRSSSSARYSSSRSRSPVGSVASHQDNLLQLQNWQDFPLSRSRPPPGPGSEAADILTSGLVGSRFASSSSPLAQDWQRIPSRTVGSADGSRTVNSYRMSAEGNNTSLKSSCSSCDSALPDIAGRIARRAQLLPQSGARVTRTSASGPSTRLSLPYIGAPSQCEAVLFGAVEDNRKDCGRYPTPNLCSRGNRGPRDNSEGRHFESDSDCEQDDDDGVVIAGQRLARHLAEDGARAVERQLREIEFVESMSVSTRPVSACSNFSAATSFSRTTSTRSGLSSRVGRGLRRQVLEDLHRAASGCGSDRPDETSTDWHGAAVGGGGLLDRGLTESRRRRLERLRLLRNGGRNGGGRAPAGGDATSSVEGRATTAGTTAGRGNGCRDGVARNQPMGSAVARSGPSWPALNDSDSDYAASSGAAGPPGSATLGSTERPVWASDNVHDVGEAAPIGSFQGDCPPRPSALDGTACACSSTQCHGVEGCSGCANRLHKRRGGDSSGAHPGPSLGSHASTVRSRARSVQVDSWGAGSPLGSVAAVPAADGWVDRFPKGGRRASNISCNGSSAGSPLVAAGAGASAGAQGKLATPAAGKDSAGRCNGGVRDGSGSDDGVATRFKALLLGLGRRMLCLPKQEEAA